MIEQPQLNIILQLDHLPPFDGWWPNLFATLPITVMKNNINQPWPEIAQNYGTIYTENKHSGSIAWRYIVPYQVNIYFTGTKC